MLVRGFAGYYRRPNVNAMYIHANIVSNKSIRKLSKIILPKYAAAVMYAMTTTAGFRAVEIIRVHNAHITPAPDK